MFYLSKGVLLAKHGDTLKIGCIGKTCTLSGKAAQLWTYASKKVGRSMPPYVDALIQQGLIETSEESNPLVAAYQILNRSVLYVMDNRPIQITLSPSCRRLLRWLARTTFPLSAADLVRIQDLSLPESLYVREHNQEHLIAALYQGIEPPLETAMLDSPAFGATMIDLLTLVHDQYIRLL